MKTILIAICLCGTACQQASPPWDTIAFVLGDTIEAPKKQPTKNNNQYHPLE